jgi:hypothetical protein
VDFAILRSLVWLQPILFCITSKTLKEVSEAMAEILSKALVPKILRSDNGGDFLG